MGKKAREIVELNLKELVADLNRGVAFEWLAAYQFWVSSQVARGPESPVLTEKFKKQVSEEIGHAETLAKRIAELGGTPIKNPKEWLKAAPRAYLEPPRDASNLKTMLQNALKTEAGAIEYYSKLAKKTFQKDPVTYAIAIQLLKSEVEEEEEFEALLKKA